MRVSAVDSGALSPEHLLALRLRESRPSRRAGVSRRPIVVPIGERNVATATNEIDDIRRKMAMIRRELHEDVRNVVETAEAVSDWRHYIRTYPWASIGLAVAVGYMLVPKRRKTVKPDEVARAVVAEIPQVTVQAAAPEPPRKASGGLIKAGLGLLAPIAMRAAQNYATHFLANWVAQQQQGHMDAMMAAAGMSPGSEGTGGPNQMQGGQR
jgi:hypothetical protein